MNYWGDLHISEFLRTFAGEKDIYYVKHGYIYARYGWLSLGAYGNLYGGMWCESGSGTLRA